MSLSLHPKIKPGQSLDENLDGLKVVETDRLADVKPIAIVNIYWRLKERPRSFKDDSRYGLVRELGEAKIMRYKIGSAKLYDPKDISDKLGDDCPEGYSPIVSVGRFETCDLRPAIVDDWGNELLSDTSVSRYHFVVSYDAATKRIMISDVGTEHNGSMHGTYVNGKKLSGTTIPWEEGEFAEIGRRLPGEHGADANHRVAVDYEITDDYGRAKVTENADAAADAAPKPIENVALRVLAAALNIL